jgi:hypothetical protein
MTMLPPDMLPGDRRDAVLVGASTITAAPARWRCSNPPFRFSPMSTDYSHRP